MKYNRILTIVFTALGILGLITGTMVTTPVMAAEQISTPQPGIGTVWLSSYTFTKAEPVKVVDCDKGYGFWANPADMLFANERVMFNSGKVGMEKASRSQDVSLGTGLNVYFYYTSDPASKYIFQTKYCAKGWTWNMVKDNSR